MNHGVNFEVAKLLPIAKGMDSYQDAELTLTRTLCRFIFQLNEYLCNITHDIFCLTYR